MKGMARTEVTRASSDAAFAKTVFDRHANYTKRTAAGENPVDPNTRGDFDLWRWQQWVGWPHTESEWATRHILVAAR